MKNLFYATIVLMSLFTACKTTTAEIKKEEGRPLKLKKYYVRYIEQSKQLQVEAKYFNENDSAFAMPGGVFVSDFKLEAKNLPKEGWLHRYIKKPAQFDSVYIFTYKPAPEVEKKDSIVFPFYHEFKVETPKFAKKIGGLITWSGNSLTQDDGLTIVFEDAAGANFTINHVGITRGPQLEIRPEHLEAMSKGKAILRVVHKRSHIEKIGDTRIVHLTEYYRTPIEIEITD